MSLTLQIKFLANRAQYDDAVKAAREAIVRELFGDLLRWLAYARKAVFDHEPKAVLYALGELEKELID